MKRIAELVMTVCFLGFLAAALVITLTRPLETVSHWENRSLAAFPEYSPESVGDGSYAAQLEQYLSDHAGLRTTMLRARTGMDLLLRRPVVNDVVLTEGSLLPFLPYETEEDPRPMEFYAGRMADNLARIRDTAAECGGWFCYVAVPPQAVSRWEEYPWYLNNQDQFNREKVSALTAAMAERGVPFLDIQSALEGRGGSAQYASRVDNHTSMEGAYETCRLILEKAAAETGLDFPIPDREDLTLETLPNDYLGSRERKLLNMAQRDERLSVLLPKTEVPFTRTDSGAPSQPFVYEMPASDDEAVTYNLYMGGDKANTVIDTGRDELPSILIFGDSFTNPVECLAYLSFDEMHSLDLRHYHDMSVEDYIRQLRPEIVVCIRDYDFLLDVRDNGGGHIP